MAEIAEAASPASLREGAEAASEAAWPTAYSRRTPAFESGSMVDPADATAWSMPYTDLTMLLMVFFIVMLSIVGPNPSESTEPSDPTKGGGAQVTNDLPDGEKAASHEATIPVVGGDGILEGSAGLLPDGNRQIEGEGAANDRLADNVSGAETDSAQSENAVADVPDADMPDDDFARAWAERVSGLEQEAETYLLQTGLDAMIALNRTDTGIELRLPDHLLFSSGSA